ncbi:tRNA glutamyl-Q(34) synthetase GluQRS [Fretibacter rubidus]|uniref:tRNA glutamyl-Q(34) synthetase GluQRS n=1 Tax=Fretibacter rubidus TaxID=570162 RepID=UPI00352B9A44
MLTRFAPSPTGYLHFGHALAAREAFDFAAKQGGSCLLRIEDIDHTRCRPAFIDAIYEDLAWLGFSWPTPVRVQSEHLSDYASVIEALREKDLIYRCYKTRRELPNGPYFGPNKPLSKTEEDAFPSVAKPFAWRLSMAAAKTALGENFTVQYYDNDVLKSSDPSRHGNIVLARKDIGTSYHIAVTHDDHIQGISHIVRGRDLSDQTDIHVLIQRLMGWDTPRYYHHGLLMGDDGKKLSKRNFDTTIRSLRAAGKTPKHVFDMVSSGVIR